MNKNNVYRSIGHLEAFFIAKKYDSFNSDEVEYVQSHIKIILDYVDNSICINNTSDDFCKITKVNHVYFDGKCDYCGKMKDET